MDNLLLWPNYDGSKFALYLTLCKRAEEGMWGKQHGRWQRKSGDRLLTYRRPRRVAKPLTKPRASEWPQDSVNGSWLAFIAGLRVEAGKCSRGLPRPAKDEGAGDG